MEQNKKTELLDKVKDEAKEVLETTETEFKAWWEDFKIVFLDHPIACAVAFVICFGAGAFIF